MNGPGVPPKSSWSVHSLSLTISLQLIPLVLSFALPLQPFPPLRRTQSISAQLQAINEWPFPIQSTWRSSLIINIPRAYTYLHVVFYKSNYYKILIRQQVSKNLKLLFGVWSIFKLAPGGRCVLREPATPTSSSSRHHPYQVLLPVISPSLSVDRSNPWRVLPISLMFLCYMWPYRKVLGFLLLDMQPRTEQHFAVHFCPFTLKVHCNKV